MNDVTKLRNWVENDTKFNTSMQEAVEMTFRAVLELADRVAELEATQADGPRSY